jgi:hypothetical protein
MPDALNLIMGDFAKLTGGALPADQDGHIAVIRIGDGPEIYIEEDDAQSDRIHMSAFIEVPNISYENQSVDMSSGLITNDLEEGRTWMLSRPSGASVITIESWAARATLSAAAFYGWIREFRMAMNRAGENWPKETTHGS